MLYDAPQAAIRDTFPPQAVIRDASEQAAIKHIAAARCHTRCFRRKIRDVSTASCHTGMSLPKLPSAGKFVKAARNISAPSCHPGYVFTASCHTGMSPPRADIRDMLLCHATSVVSLPLRPSLTMMLGRRRDKRELRSRAWKRHKNTQTTRTLRKSGCQHRTSSRLTNISIAYRQCPKTGFALRCRV